MTLLSQSAPYSVVVEIGGIPVTLLTQDNSFRGVLEGRYQNFINPDRKSDLQLDIDLTESSSRSDADLQVRMQGKEWTLRRGDFSARWDPKTGRGRVQQTANPYSIDALLRIIHTLVLAGQGGFLVHAASAIRNGKAFLFSGVSGAGKTTISRLAPPDAVLLTDEVSFVKPGPGGYCAFGTPFAGELAKVGENCSAPLDTLFLLHKGPANRVEDVPPAEALSLLLRNILFFAEDSELANLVFQSACNFVETAKVRRLVFFPDQRVWDLIG